MKGIKIVAILSLIFCSTLSYGTELSLEKSYFIDSKKEIEPSGLALKNGVFYFISDSEDEKIYKLIFDGDKCKSETAYKFDFNGYSVKSLNYEGITAGDDGNYYLLSEPEYKIIKVSEKGSVVITDSFLKDGRDLGFFKGKAKGPEGICVYKGGKKVIIASQSDKGKLIEGDIVNNKLVNMRAITIVSKEINEGKTKNNWISDLYMYKDKVYALLKKQNSIVELKRNGNTFVESGIYSYNNAISSKKYSYLKGNDFGEGLVVDDNRFYVIFDNNKDGRIENIKDNRPLFIILKK